MGLAFVIINRWMLAHLYAIIVLIRWLDEVRIRLARVYVAEAELLRTVVSIALPDRAIKVY